MQIPKSLRSGFPSSPIMGRNKKNAAQTLRQLAYLVLIIAFARRRQPGLCRGVEGNELVYLACVSE